MSATKARSRLKTPSKTLARSRLLAANATKKLTKSSEIQEKKIIPTKKKILSFHKKNLPTTFSNKTQPKKLFKQTQQLSQKLSQHLRYSLALFLSLGLFTTLFFLLRNVYPEQIANFLFPQSYLPFFFLLWLASFFFFAFLFLDKKKAFLLSNLVTFYCFLRLQRIEIDGFFCCLCLGLPLLLQATLFLRFQTKKPESHI